MPYKKAKMTPSQKVIVKDFLTQYYNMMEAHWNPSEQEEYWDDLTDEAMMLISKFKTNDDMLNDFMKSIVVSFINSREDMLS